MDSETVENGAEEDRTPNLGIANAALSQLSYRPDKATAAIIRSDCAPTRDLPPKQRWYGTRAGLSSLPEKGPLFLN